MNLSYLKEEEEFNNFLTNDEDKMIANYGTES